MNTSTVYIEPVFVGALVGIAIGLPFFPELVGFQELLARNPQPSAAVVGVFAVGAVAIAYLIGIPADRTLDSAMGALERHCRIRFALKFKDDQSDSKADLFPEDRYRTKIFLSGKPIVDWLQYVRTRVRLMRALAVTLPALTFAIVVCGAWSFDQVTKFVVPLIWLLTAVAVWLCDRHAKRDRKPNDPGRMATRWHPPRTDRRSEIDCYAAERNGRRYALFWDVMAQPVVWGAVLLFLASCTAAIARWNGDCQSQLKAIAGVAFAALLTWIVGVAWWRTSETFMTYVRLAGRDLDELAALELASKRLASRRKTANG